jgi:hypothetical protein
MPEDAPSGASSGISPRESTGRLDCAEAVTGESGLPGDVVALLHRALPSMVHVELVLLLARRAPAGVRVIDAAAELRSDPRLVQDALADLQRAQLAMPGPGTDETSFDGSDPARVATVVSLQDVYDRRPVTLIKVMYQRPTDPLQAFSDAFRLRPGDR